MIIFNAETLTATSKEKYMDTKKKKKKVSAKTTHVSFFCMWPVHAFCDMGKYGLLSIFELIILSIISKILRIIF